MLYVNGTDDIIAKISSVCAKRHDEFDENLTLGEWMDLLGEEMVDGLDIIFKDQNTWKTEFKDKMICASAMIVLMIERFCGDERGKVGDK